VSDDVLLWKGSAPLTRAAFLATAAQLAQQFPARSHLANLCEQRSNFLLTFMAAIMAQQTQLLPAARTAAAAVELAGQFPDCHPVTDADVERWCSRATGTAPPAALPAIDPQQIVLVGFTSGSTGQPQPHAKRWRALEGTAKRVSAAIRGALEPAYAGSAPAVVATVPSHHMYGIETTVLMPLFAGASVHTARPLFPADIAGALAEVPAPRVLVSTPLHLRALVESGIETPAIALIVCATAPLDAALAARIEAHLAVPLLDFLGSTETTVIATRRTAREEEWRLFDGVEIEALAEHTRVSASWFDEDKLLQDVLEPRGARRFILRGRHADLIEVAGKRASLADITRRLCAVPGVVDAVAFQPEVAATGVAQRVAALVVSETSSVAQIIAALAPGLDPVFLPRPLLLVTRIPRDALGKIQRARLLEIVRSRSE